MAAIDDMPMPDMRNATVSGNPVQKQRPRNIATRDRASGGRWREKPWWLPSWMWQQQQQAAMEAAAYDEAIMTSNASMPMAGSSLAMPYDQSADFTDQLNDNSSWSNDYMQDPGPSGATGHRDTGGTDQSSYDSSIYSGVSAGANPSPYNDPRHKHKKKHKDTNKRLHNQPDSGSSDADTSSDMDTQAPYDDSNVGYSEPSSGQNTPYNTLSSPANQPNPWGYGPGGS